MIANVVVSRLLATCANPAQTSRLVPALWVCGGKMSDADRIEVLVLADEKVCMASATGRAGRTLKQLAECLVSGC